MLSNLPDGCLPNSIIIFLNTSAKTDLWHRSLGHPSTTILRRMLPLLIGYNLSTTDAKKATDCEAYIHGKMIKRPFMWQLPTELPPSLHRLHEDICGPMNPPWDNIDISLSL